MPRWAMAASAASRPASWRAWAPSALPASAMASAMITGCSGSSSTMAGRSNGRRTGYRSVTPGSSSGRRCLRDRLRRHRRLAQHRSARAAAPGGIRPSGCWPSPSTRRSPAGRAKRVNTLRLWSARSTDLMRLEEFNRGDYVGALADQARAESISRVLYPDDSTPTGQELAPQAGILLHLRLAAGSDPPPPRPSTRPRQPARQGRDPAQRYPPCPRRARADAALIDEHAVHGTRPGGSRAAASPTPTTRCCPKRWRAGRWR